jgi:phosphatidylinositol glycan class O
MDSGEVFTPLSDITGQSSAPKVQKPAQQPQQPQQQQPAQSQRTAIHDPDKAKKVGQVHFKAAHGIIVAFFTFIL